MKFDALPIHHPQVVIKIRAWYGMEKNVNFGMEYGKCQKWMDWKISRMEWKTIFHTNSLLGFAQGIYRKIKSLFPKRLISTSDVFEKLAKNGIEVFFFKYFVNLTFWGLQTYTSSKPKSLKS